MGINNEPLLIATGNAHKTEEFAELLAGVFTVTDLTQHQRDFPEIEETGTTFAANATIKALAISKCTPGVWVLADDSGLEVDALNGDPGVRSARYSGLNATDQTNRSKLLQSLTNTSHRTARFRCVLILAKDGEVVHQAEGTIEGSITSEERGKGGFGYDPLFVPEGYRLTFAELPPETKNSLSHRGRAVQALLRLLQTS